jgi:hypothetical protein
MDSPPPDGMKSIYISFIQFMYLQMCLRKQFILFLLAVVVLVLQIDSQTGKTADHATNGTKPCNFLNSLGIMILFNQMTQQ